MVASLFFICVVWRRFIYREGRQATGEMTFFFNSGALVFDFVFRLSFDSEYAVR
jgi:hypothetical protein